LAVLDGELAVPCSPRSASAGLNPLLKGPELSWLYLIPVPVGHHATDEHEPRQVRKEAAVSAPGCVAVKSDLVAGRCAVCLGQSDEGCTAKSFFPDISSFFEIPP